MDRDYILIRIETGHSIHVCDPPSTILSHGVSTSEQLFIRATRVRYSSDVSNFIAYLSLFVCFYGFISRRSILERKKKSIDTSYPAMTSLPLKIAIQRESRIRRIRCFQERRYRSTSFNLQDKKLSTVLRGDTLQQAFENHHCWILVLTFILLQPNETHTGHFDFVYSSASPASTASFQKRISNRIRNDDEVKTRGSTIITNDAPHSTL